MRATVREQTKKANRGADQSVASAPTLGFCSAKSYFSYQEHVRKLIREAWPDGTTKELAHAGKISLRQAERVLGRQKEISLKLLWELLENKEFGQRFHWAILDNLTADWSAVQRRDREYIAIQNQKRELERREEQWRRGGTV